MPHYSARVLPAIDRRSCWLNHRAHRVHSQFGEEGIIDAVLEVLDAPRPPEGPGYCVEFGAGDGCSLSNTLSLIERRGFSGLLIEPEESAFERLRERHARRPGVTCVNGLVELSGPNTLEGRLERAGAPARIDVLSIDVDGLDWHLWLPLRRWRPRLVIIEFNPTMPHDLLWVQDPDPDVREGSSLRAMVTLGRAKRYELVATTATNGFFVPAEEFPRFGIPDNRIETLHPIRPYASTSFQDYDSRLHLCGQTEPLWGDPGDRQPRAHPLETIIEHAPAGREEGAQTEA